MKLKFCVLLTATIDTNNCWYVERKDIKVREKDYLFSLKKWLKNTNFKIVFCENSGYDLRKIKKLAKKFPERIEIIQFKDNNYPRYLGKGYGELRIINYAIKKSEFIKNSDYIIKSTGRIFVKNINNLVSQVKRDFVLVMPNKHPKPKAWKYESICFIFKKEFAEYLKKYKNQLNDKKYFFFENALEKSFLDARLQGKKCGTFLYYPEYEGHSATTNVYLGKSILRSRIKYFIGKLGGFLKKYFPLIYCFLKRSKNRQRH